MAKKKRKKKSNLLWYIIGGLIAAYMFVPKFHTFVKEQIALFKEFLQRSKGPGNSISRKADEAVTEREEDELDDTENA
jgi:hypothetical protein